MCAMLFRQTSDIIAQTLTMQPDLVPFNDYLNYNR